MSGLGVRPIAGSARSVGRVGRERRQGDHEAIMCIALAEAERARGATGDNPWVGCVIVDPDGAILGSGHTREAGGNHAEIEALREVEARGGSAAGATLYSTLEPCSFHGRTPACARIIVEHGIARVVIAITDPHPRVDGEGVKILQRAGVEVIAGVSEREVRRQLGEWILTEHPHEPIRRARALANELGWRELIEMFVDQYATDPRKAEAIVGAARRDSLSFARAPDRQSSSRAPIMQHKPRDAAK